MKKMLHMYLLCVCCCFSYYASTSFPVGPPRLVPPLKRPRLMTNSGRNGKATQQKNTTTTACIEQLKTYSKYTAKKK